MIFGSNHGRLGSRLFVALIASALIVGAVVIVAGRDDVAAPSSLATASSMAAAAPEAKIPGRLGSGQSVRLAFAGDVHFEPPIRGYLDSDPASVFAPIAPVLRRADVAMLNLETAVTERGEMAPDKAYHFRAPASALAAIRSSGVDVVTLANNHGMDWGVTGLRDTLRSAKAAGVPLIGAGPTERAAYAPYRVSVNGQRIAILAATQVLDSHLRDAWTAQGRRPGLASASREDRLLQAVRQARDTSDTVVVYLHWGNELVSCPTDMQRLIARRLAGAGADVIVGSHAHIPLGAGRMGGAFVAYGLGNFVFYASREDNSRSGVLEVTVTGRRIDGYSWRPARIIDGRPTPLVGRERKALLADWNALRACTGLSR